MNKLFLLVLLGGFALPSASSAIDLKQAKFTQVVNNVEVISTANKSRHAAGVSDTFQMPDVLRTGPASRAELVADDSSITRVGANTVFSFDPARRTIDLEQGSLLFHSPHGKGGGTICTGSATASVLGTTIIVTTTPNGGFKILVLEGQAEIRFLNGKHITLSPGQMTFILPGGGTSPIVVFRLDDQTRGSLLVNGFNNPLPSWPNIQTEITRQLILLLNNKVQDTDLVVGDNATPDTVQVRMDLLGNDPFNNNASIIGADKVGTDPNPVSYPPLNSRQVEVPVKLPGGVASFDEGLTFLGIIGSPAAGFVGNDIDIDTANVDLSTFAADPEFAIMAKGDMRIWQSVNFTPPPVGPVVVPAIFIPGAPGTIGLFAGGQMAIAPFATLEADTSIFGLVAGSFGVLNTDTGTTAIPNTIENDSFYNTIGDVDMLSLSDLTIEGMDSFWTVFAGGGVNIQSDGNLTLGILLTPGLVTPLDNGHDVAIDAGGDVTLSAGLASGGDLNVGSAEIYAGDNGLSGLASFTGGSINMNAGNDVFVMDSYLSAYSGEIGVGDVNIFGAGNVDIEGTYIHADGDVNIESGGTLTLGVAPSFSLIVSTGDSIEAGGNVFLTSDNADVNVFDSTITSDAGDVEVNALNGFVDIENSSIYSFDNNNSVTVSGADISQTGSDINYTASGGNISIDGGSGVTILDSDFYLGGNITISGSTLSTDGSINLTANGGTLSVTTSESEDISGLNLHTGDIDVSGSTLDAGGDLNLTANGPVLNGLDQSLPAGNIDVENSTLVAGDSSLAATGGSVNINAYDGNVTLNGDGINAYSGGNEGSGFVTIFGNGTVDVENTSIFANNDVGVESGGTLTVGNLTGNTIEAGGSVYLTSDGADIGVFNSSVFADNTDINLAANNGGITVGNSLLSAFGSIYLNAGEDIDINNGSVLNATVGSPAIPVASGDQISISGGGTVTINGNFGANGFGYDIGADNLVYINGSSEVDIFDAVIETLDGSFSDTVEIDSGGPVYLGSDIIGSYGGVTISGGVVTVDGTDVTGYGSDVSITSDGTVSVAPLNAGVGAGSILIENSSDVEAGGGAFLTSDNGDVDVFDSTISSAVGDVEINALNGFVDIENSTINSAAFNNLNPSDGSQSGPINLVSHGGNISIDGGSGVTILGSDFYLGGNVLVSGTTLVSTFGYVSIIANGGTLSVATAGTEDISGLNLHTGDITIDNNSTIDAGGNVNLIANGPVLNGLNQAIIAGNIDVENSTLIAGDGNLATIGGSLNINSLDGNVTLNGDSITAYSGTAAGSGNVTVTAANGITVNNSSVAGDAAAGTVELDSSAGQTTIENGSTAQAFYLNVNSPDGILIDGISGGGVHLSGNTMNLTGSFTDPTKGITVNNADLTAFATVNMSAHTVSLTDVAFGAGSFDNFHTFFGALAANPNTGALAQSGYLNFINGVTYGGTLITGGNQSTYVNPASGPGVFVSTLPL